VRDIGPLEIALIVGAIVLIFGVGKLGDIGGAIGKSIHDFRKERDRTDDSPQATPTDAKVANPTAQIEARSGKTCPNCSNRVSDKAKFCMACGTKL
jgi:TatA/E family protein of Tat protein translocase